MKYKIKDKCEEIVSQHTKLKYLNSVSAWKKKNNITVYYQIILPENRFPVEGETLRLVFNNDLVDTSELHDLIDISELHDLIDISNPD
jgi:hypothetical protein